MTKVPASAWKPTPRSWHGSRPLSAISRVIIHTEEGSQEGTYSVFTNGPYCAHLNIGRDSVWQHADLETLVWHCVNANSNGVGIEHSGFASQSRATWLSAALRKQLRMSANRTAWICYTCHLGEPQKGKNVFGHVDIPGNSHWDPGPGFPWRFYMWLCRRAFKNLQKSNGKRWTLGKVK